MPSQSMPTRYFIAGLIGLGLFYLGFELFFNRYAMLSVDEFWFAHRIYQYRDGLPYRDFAPYKTVLGYYLLLIPLLFSDGILTTLIFTKQVIALINTCILLGSSLWLTRFFSRSAILTSLSLLVSAEIVLSYSTNIRVDLLGYWFCFFSLLFLLENRFLIAGLLLGLGFITTQKALWYIFASNCALGTCWLASSRRTKTIWQGLQFNFMIVCVIALYVAFWSWLVDGKTVVNSVFYEASVMYHLDWYESARSLFWMAITLYNPLLFLLWPLTLLSVAVTYDDDNTYDHRLFVVTYAIVILLCLIPYKQVFPYYMQVTIPIFFTLYAAFFTWLFAIFQPARSLTILIGKSGLWLLLTLYIAGIIFISLAFQLPPIYLLICLIPLLLGVYLTAQAKSKLTSVFFNLIVITLIFIGFVYPFLQFSIRLMALDGAYQKAQINAIHALLKDGSDYVAGIELIYNKTQPIAGMRHLMGPAIDYLYYPSEKLRPAMLASLYEDPNVTADSVIAAFKKSSVKFYVNNERMAALPDNIKNYLASEYEHFWGSIYLYAPKRRSGQEKFSLKFSGNYLIESAQSDAQSDAQSNHVILNGKKYATHIMYYLKKGNYTSNAHESYRLKLIPEPAALSLNPEFTQDDWKKVI
jgi:hypothetical protein